MVTQKGDNTSVIAIHGNFDNAQSGVKAMFENKKLAKELDQAFDSIRSKYGAGAIKRGTDIEKKT